MLLERREKWPSRVDVVPKKPQALGDAAAMVTFIGHPTFLIQTAAGNIITDPVYSMHAGPFGRLGPRRVREPAVRFDDLPPISTILLSHCHYDHCDLPTLRRLVERFDPQVVTALGNADLLETVGATKIEEITGGRPRRARRSTSPRRPRVISRPALPGTRTSGCGAASRSTPDRAGFISPVIRRTPVSSRRSRSAS